MNRVTAVPYIDALRVFSRRFPDDVPTDEIAHRFNELFSRGLLDFQRGSDGELKVLLAAARKP